VLYLVTVDDPRAYATPWAGGFYLGWTPNADLFEYVCQENVFASEPLVGAGESVDRASRIVP
jgi:hypothetical protein